MCGESNEKCIIPKEKEKVMEANDCWPENVICAENTNIWNHYERVNTAPVIGGMHHSLRFLYKRCALLEYQTRMI